MNGVNSGNIDLSMIKGFLMGMLTTLDTSLGNSHGVNVMRAQNIRGNRDHRKSVVTWVIVGKMKKKEHAPNPLTATHCQDGKLRENSVERSVNIASNCVKQAFSPLGGTEGLLAIVPLRIVIDSPLHWILPPSVDVIEMHIVRG